MVSLVESHAKSMVSHTELKYVAMIKILDSLKMSIIYNHMPEKISHD